MMGGSGIGAGAGVEVVAEGGCYWVAGGRRAGIPAAPPGSAREYTSNEFSRGRTPLAYLAGPRSV